MLVFILLNYSRLLFTMRRISEEIRDNILSLLDTGLSSRAIEAQLCVSRTTVNKVRASIRSSMQKSRSGRPAKLTATDKRKLVRTIASGKAKCATRLAREMNRATGMELSTQTVYR